MASTQTETLGGRVIAREAALLVALAGITALAAKVAIYLPWTPVPATLQVAAVVFVGCAFGPRRGALSQALYLATGLCGLPVFASATVAGPAAVFSPSFGYLLSFPVAAYLAGRWTGPKARWLSASAALASIYLLGMGWLVIWAAMSGKEPTLTWALLAGMLTFLPFDLLKAALAVWSAGPVRRRLDPA